MEKKRIDYIDLAKGICILLVVLYHCSIYFDEINYIRMPFYFFLSGLFFKEYNNIVNFIKMKTNKILIPFIFFYLLSFFLTHIITVLKPDFKFNSFTIEKYPFESIIDSASFFNYPIWFLISLFSVNILFYIIKICSLNKNYIQCILIILLTSGGFLLNKESILPFYLGRTLYYIPFFYIGYLLRKTNFLYPNKLDKYNLILFICTLLLYILSVQLIGTIKDDNFAQIFTYFISITGVIGLMILCKMIKKIPLITFYGRYSIVILCTHFIIMTIVNQILDAFINIYEYNFLRFIIIIILEIPTIKFCIKYLGYFVAQKNLIRVQ